MKCRFFLTAVLASLLHAATAIAQTPSDCANLMKFGIYDRFNTLTAESRFRQVQSFVREFGTGTIQQTRQNATALGIDIEDILSLSFNGKSSSTDFASWRNEFLQTTFEVAQAQGLTRTQIERISPQLTALVQRCLDTIAVGVQAFLTPAADQETFTYTVAYKPNGPPFTTHGTVAVQPATVASTCAPAGQIGTMLEIGPGGFSISCRRLPNETVTILANTDNGNRSTTYDAVQVPEPTVAFRTEEGRDRIVAGETITLIWSVANAAKVELEGTGQVQPTGRLVVQPSQTTTYNLAVTSLHGVRRVSPLQILVDVPPTLQDASVMFHVTDDNKDHDTKLHIEIVCGGNVVAALDRDQDEEWNDGSPHGPFGLTVFTHIRRVDMRSCSLRLNERPSGHDEFHFRWSGSLSFSDGSTFSIPEQGGDVDYDRPNASIDFRP